MVTEQFIQQVATLQERDRLSQEMHDHLAPSLGYIKLKASLVEEALENEDVAQAQAHLQELKEAVANLYTDVREGIFNLRTQIRSRPEITSHIYK